MASTAFFKGTGLLLFLILGLQPSSFVSGQNITTSSNSMTDAASTVAASTAATTVTAITAQATMSSAISSTNAVMSSAGLATTMAATTVQGAAKTTTSTSNSSNIGSMTTTMNSTSRSATIDSGNTVAGSGNTSTNNTTSWGNSGMTMISCRQFSCNYSDCYDVYMNRTSVSCNANITFCELMRQEDMTYTGGCSSSCRNACVNDTQTNCTMGCCNSTGCLSSTLASMVRASTTTVTTVRMTTTTTEATTTTTAKPTNTLKKCQMFQCTEQNCYKTWITKDPMPCPLNQPYCELKKTTAGSTTTWMGGCSTDCTKNTWCSTTTDTCHQECCNTSMTSCLKLDGALNVPSSATRGPHFPLALVTAALLVCLLSIGSLV